MKDTNSCTVTHPQTHEQIKAGLDPPLLSFLLAIISIVATNTTIIAGSNEVSGSMAVPCQSTQGSL